MKIPLQSSLQAINRANGMYVAPIDLLRVVNISQPKRWFFYIRFEKDGSNNIDIRSEPPMEFADIQKALDGRLPIFYSANGIFFRDGNVYHAAKPYAKEDTIEVDFEPTQFKLEGELALKGAGDIICFQNEASLREWLYQNTWLGSTKFEKKNASLVIELFGHRYEIIPKRHPAKFGYPALEKHLTIKDDGLVCEVLVTLMPRKSHTNIIRHARFGAFTIEQSCPGFWKALHPLGDISIHLEIDDKEISWWSSFGPENSNYLKRLGTALVSSLTSLAASSEHKKFIKELGEWEKHQSAARLDKRQSEAESRAKVFLGDRELLCLPTCENEVLCLYSKLEALDIIPIECRIIEYTAKLGIDALGHFRFSKSEALNKFSPIEFEMLADNFLAHEHPVEQTKLIVCWNVLDESLFKREVGKPWLRKLIIKGDSIPVLVLSDIPKIKIVE